MTTSYQIWNVLRGMVYETPNSQHPKFFVKGAKVKREGVTFTVVGFKMSCGIEYGVLQVGDNPEDVISTPSTFAFDPVI